jgi:hypothetical protein
MSLNLQIVAVLFLLAILVSIIYILRKGRIAIKYALVWFFAALVLLIFIIFPGLMNSLTNLLGFEVGSNMIFAGLIAMLIFINIALTVIVSGQSSKIRLLIQEVSMLKGKIDEKR